MKKWKWIYSIIFSIMLVVVGLFMYPEKKVKALEEDYKPILIKGEPGVFVLNGTETNHYEFRVRYTFENIIIEELNRLEYFLVTSRPYNIRHDIYDKTIDWGSYEVDRINIDNNNNLTYIYLKVLLLRTWIDEDYGDPYYGAYNFFTDDSAFYIYAEIPNGYDEGYNDGYDVGLQNGYNEGYSDGYDDGVLDGFDEGYNNGYNYGIEEGYNSGYDDGKVEGFNDGYIEGTKETTKFPTLLRNIFEGVSGFLGIQLLPGISIGAIIAIPIVFGIIAFILGRRRG